jgi:hypothetical protein
MCITSKSVIYDAHSFFRSNIYKSKYKRKKETKMLLENVLKFFKAMQFLFYFIILFYFYWHIYNSTKNNYLTRHVKGVSEWLLVT